MQGSKKKKRDRSILLPIIFMLFICSFFLPLFMVGMLQDMLFYSKDNWFFSTPASAIWIFFMGMVLIPIALTAHYVMTNMFEKKFMKWVTPILILISLPLLFLSILNYYYMDDKGVHLNKFMSVSEKTVNWVQIKEIKENYRMIQGAPELYEYVFTTKNNEKITVPYRLDYRKVSDHIDEKIKENHIKVTSNEDELVNY